MTTLIDLRNFFLAERESGQLTEIPRNLNEEAQVALKEHRGRIFSALDPLADETQIAIDEADGIDELIEQIYAMRIRKIVLLALVTDSKASSEEIRRMIPEERKLFDDTIQRINKYRQQVQLAQTVIPQEPVKAPSLTPGTPLPQSIPITASYPPQAPPTYPPQPSYPQQPAPTPIIPPVQSAVKPPATFGAGIEGGTPAAATRPAPPSPPPPKPATKPTQPTQKPLVPPEPVKTPPKPATKSATPPAPPPQVPKPTPHAVPGPAPKPTGTPPDKLVIVTNQDIEPFVGVDGRTYTLKKGSLEIVPRENAEALIARGVAKASGSVSKK